MYMIFRQLCFKSKFRQNIKKKQNNTLKVKESINSLFKPVPVKENSDNAIGIELTGSLNKRKIIQILCDFAQKEEIKELTINYGLDGNFY